MSKSKRIHPVDILIFILFGVCVIIFTIFLTLKLAGIGLVAGWSWWLVTLPLAFWGYIFLAAAFIGFFIIRPYRWIQRQLNSRSNLQRMMADE